MKKLTITSKIILFLIVVLFLFLLPKVSQAAFNLPEETIPEKPRVMSDKEYNEFKKRWGKLIYPKATLHSKSNFLQHCTCLSSAECERLYEISMSGNDQTPASSEIFPFFPDVNYARIIRSFKGGEVEYMLTYFSSENNLQKIKTYYTDQLQQLGFTTKVESVQVHYDQDEVITIYGGKGASWNFRGNKTSVLGNEGSALIQVGILSFFVPNSNKLFPDGMLPSHPCSQSNGSVIAISIFENPEKPTSGKTLIIGGLSATIITLTSLYFFVFKKG